MTWYGIGYFFVSRFVNIPNIICICYIAKHQTKLPVIFFKLQAGIKTKSPGTRKFPDYPSNYFGIHAILQSGKVQFSGIGKSKSIVGSREKTDPVVVDIALTVNQFSSIHDVINPKTNQGNAPSALVINRFCVGDIVVLGNIGKIVGMHQRYLVVFYMDESCRIPIARIHVISARSHRIRHPECRRIDTNIHKFIRILSNDLRIRTNAKQKEEDK